MSDQRLTKAERKALRKQEKEQKEIIKTSRRRFWRNMMVVFGIFAFALIVYLINFLWQSDVTAVADVNDPIKGSPNAKVVIRAYSDFECPACQQAALSVGRAASSFSEDEVALIFNDYPLIEMHPKAYEASLAGQCANEQGKFWEMHDRIFLDQDTWKNMDDPREKMVSYARAFDLDEESFRACLEEERYKNLIQEDIAEGLELEINATPTYFINRTRIVGAKPVEEIEKIINEALGK